MIHCHMPYHVGGWNGNALGSGAQLDFAFEQVSDALKRVFGQVLGWVLGWALGWALG